MQPQSYMTSLHLIKIDDFRDPYIFIRQTSHVTLTSYMTSLHLIKIECFMYS